MSDDTNTAIVKRSHEIIQAGKNMFISINSQQKLHSKSLLVWTFDSFDYFQPMHFDVLSFVGLLRLVSNLLLFLLWLKVLARFDSKNVILFFLVYQADQQKSDDMTNLSYLCK